MQSVPNWQLKFSQFPHLDIELLHARNITHDYPSHMHEESSIALILQGTEDTMCRGAVHRAHAGQLLFINAEEVHSNKSVGCEYRSIKVRPKTLDRLLCDFDGTTGAGVYFAELVVDDPLLFRRLLQFHLTLQHDGSALEQQTEFVSTMGFLFERLRKKIPGVTQSHAIGNEDTYVRLVRDYLRSHFAENVSLTQLTSLTNLSPFYLLRVFHKQTGFPPHEYQTQVRIAHARKLIRKGMALSQTALETGFCDQSHLSRNFKRITGVTPRQYFSEQGV